MTDLAELTRSLAPAIEAAIEQEVVRRVGALALRQAQPIRDRDEKIRLACQRVATASDRLEAARYAGAVEIPSRRALEKACKELSKVMRGRGR